MSTITKQRGLQALRKQLGEVQQLKHKLEVELQAVHVNSEVSAGCSCAIVAQCHRMFLQATLSIQSLTVLHPKA